jgi:hypothetical protein
MLRLLTWARFKDIVLYVSMFFEVGDAGGDRQRIPEPGEKLF